jgi:hypothetical protein
MSLIPGILDTDVTHDVTSPNGLQYITINGNTSAKNFTVDGITDMDTGGNITIHFFFASQEYTRQLVNATAQYRTMPTALERAGDFSQSYNGSGALVKIIDPLSGSRFPGNVIPTSRISPMGLGILNFLPLPNNPYGPSGPGVTSLANSYNFQDAGSGPHPEWPWSCASAGQKAYSPGPPSYLTSSTASIDCPNGAGANASTRETTGTIQRSYTAICASDCASRRATRAFHHQPNQPARFT